MRLSACDMLCFSGASRHDRQPDKVLQCTRLQSWCCLPSTRHWQAWLEHPPFTCALRPACPDCCKGVHLRECLCPGPPAQRLLLANAASFVSRILFVMGLASSPHEPGFGDEPLLSQPFAECMDALALCREALRKLPGPAVPVDDVEPLLSRC